MRGWLVPRRIHGSRLNMIQPYLHGLYLFFCGICMGAADLVPGVSGGTIAFIMGFYEKLIRSLGSIHPRSLKLLLTGNWKEFNQVVDWKFLIILISGILTSFALFSKGIHFLLSHETFRIYLYASFIGLILASFYLCSREIRKWTMFVTLGFTCGTLVAFYLTTSPIAKKEKSQTYGIKIDYKPTTTVPSNYDVNRGLLTQLTPDSLGILLAKEQIKPTTQLYNAKGEEVGVASDFASHWNPHALDWWLISSGAIAICAMLLPGISGSYLLNLMGVYPAFIESLAGLFSHLKQGLIDWAAVEVLFNLGIGVVIGALLFARLLSWVLSQYSDISLGILSGFMIGALPSVWPFWAYAYELIPHKIEKGPQLVSLSPLLPSWENPETFFAALWIIFGVLLVLAIHYLANRREINSAINPAEIGIDLKSIPKD